jgi:hypothetical protein
LQGCIGCCLKVGLAHRFLSISDFFKKHFSLRRVAARSGGISLAAN